jgi:hypothetical protein
MSAIHQPLEIVMPPTRFEDLPLSAAASVAMALPVFAACGVSLLTKALYNCPERPAALWPELIRPALELNNWLAT